MMSLLLISSFALQGHHPEVHAESWFQLLDRVRTVDGSDNNREHSDWGRAGSPLLRLGSVAYGDGTGTPAGSERPSARLISNRVCRQSQTLPNTEGVSDLLWQWGQFIDHDIDETPVLVPAEAFDITVPTGDPWFDPGGTGTQVIGLNRSFYETLDGVQQQVNEITAYIDGSNVYGSDQERARALRTLDGSGRLKTSAGGLLPFNEAGLPNAPSTSPTYFLAGDFRANEQVALTAMHTLFVREHNYWAKRIAQQLRHGSQGPGGPGMGGHPNGNGMTREGRNNHRVSGEAIYQMARAMVAAELQAVTYREFLPVLLGEGALTPYSGYRPETNAGVANEFATAAYRFGHTMLPTELQRLDASGSVIAAGNLSLAQAFFRPDEIQQHGIESLLRGLATQTAQAIDPYIIDDVRNFLFGPPGAGGFDLAALNIQRGRDHGLPSYNQMRRDLGLSAALDITEVTTDPGLQRRLRAAYGNDVEAIDLWVGGLSEDARGAALVGDVIFTLLRDQFEALRDGDRFWYESAMPLELVILVEEQSLARIVTRNTNIGHEFPTDPFRVSQ